MIHYTREQSILRYTTGFKDPFGSYTTKTSAAATQRPAIVRSLSFKKDYIVPDRLNYDIIGLAHLGSVSMFHGVSAHSSSSLQSLCLNCGFLYRQGATVSVCSVLVRASAKWPCKSGWNRGDVATAISGMCLRGPV